MRNTEPKHVIYDMDSVYDGVVRQAQRYGDKVRYYYKENGEEKIVTYKQMLDHVNYISSGLDAMGYAKTTVVMTGEPHPDYVAVYDAVVSIGGVIVPLDKDITNDQFSVFSIAYVKEKETEEVAYTADPTPLMSTIMMMFGSYYGIAFAGRKRRKEEESELY